MRLIALTNFRNEMRFLPGFLRSVSPQVDGIIGLDDGSTDGSGEYFRAQPKVLEVIRIEPGTHGDYEDGILRPMLTRAAWEHEPDWLLGIDADERLEVHFRKTARGGIRSAESGGHQALWMPFRELWRPDAYRVDGIWGRKRKACLFRASRDHVFDERRLHYLWPSLAQDPSTWPELDSNLYHLRMLTAEDRQRRVETYRRLDPDNVHQAIGYEYLVDEDGLRTEKVRWRRRYRFG